MVDTMVKTRWVYAFGGGTADGDASMKDLLGGKGANLAEMSALGLPVPVQIIGQPEGEGALLALAAQLEQALPWSGRRAPVA